MLQQTVVLPTTKNLVLDLCLSEMPMVFDLHLHRCQNGVLRAQSTKRKEHQAVVEAEFRTIRRFW